MVRSPKRKRVGKEASEADEDADEAAEELVLPARGAPRDLFLGRRQSREEGPLGFWESNGLQPVQYVTDSVIGIWSPGLVVFPAVFLHGPWESWEPHLIYHALPDMVVQSTIEPLGIAANHVVGAAICAGAFAVSSLATRELRRKGQCMSGRMERDDGSYYDFALATGGVFRVTRNPKYVSNVMLAAAAAFFMNSAFLLPLVPVAWGLAQWLVVDEERGLCYTFGNEYAEYCRRVPRWLKLRWWRADYEPPEHVLVKGGAAAEKGAPPPGN